MRTGAQRAILIHDRTPQSNNQAIENAVRFTHLGAFAYLGPDAGEAEWREALQAVEEYCEQRELSQTGTGQEPWRKFLVGEAPAMQSVVHVIRLIGNRRCTVLIGGETGTGKEMAARAIHMASPRAHLPLVAVNCNALPEHLLEAELFGHVRGAFTGAVNSRVGRFEQANHSTLFLDEIGDLPLEIQAKLLRVLQEREFQRLGSSDTIRVDVRVIAATNVNLQERIRQGRFREDLYYRLNVVPITMPPLRDRRGDIPVLVHHFVDKVCRMEHLPTKTVTPETLIRLSQYDWPGNVRQLENAVEMAIALCGDRSILFPSDFPLPAAVPRKPMGREQQLDSLALPEEGIDFENTIASLELNLLHQALDRTKGNKKQAADLLRMKRTTLGAKLRSLQSFSVAAGSA
ncbi:MAG: sigma-54 dependent transcriptional regulator [Bryobacter sp.]|nr:sigma-54 dependent transcriptional regulator [Bryobacter sp.]